MPDQSQVDIVVRVQQLTQSAFDKIATDLKKIESQSGDTNKKLGDQGGILAQIIGKFGDLGAKAGPVGSAVEGVTGKLTDMGKTSVALGPVGIAIAAIGAAVITLGAAGVAGAQKLVDITQTAANLGDRMKVLSQQTDLSTQFLTKMRFVAEQTDAPFESITVSIGKMSQNVAEGGKKVSAGLEAIGLSIAEVRQMSPEQAFETILAGLNKIPDAGTRAAAGAAIFGKGFREISQLAKEDIRELGDKATELGVVFGDDFAEAGDRFNDAVGAIGTRVEGLQLQLGARLLPVAIAVAEGIEEAFGKSFKAAGFSSTGLADIVERVVVAVVQTTAKVVSFLAQAADPIAQFVAGKFISNFGLIEIFSDLAGYYLEFVKLVERVTPGDRSKEIAQLEALNSKIGDFARNASQKTADVAAGFSNVAKAVSEGAEAFGRDFQGRIANVRRELEQSAASAGKNRDAMRTVIGAIDGLGGSSDKNKPKIKSLGDELQGAVDRAKKYATDLNTGKVAIDQLGERQDETNKVLRAGREALEALGRTGDPLYATLVKLEQATRNWSGTLGPVKLGIDSILGSLRNVDDAFLNSVMFGDAGRVGSSKLGIPSGLGIPVETDIDKINAALKRNKDTTEDWTTTLRTLTSSFSDLANISGGALDGMLGQFADLVALMDQGTQFGKMARDAFYNPNKVTGKVRTDPTTGNVVPVMGGYDFSNLSGKNGTEATVGAYMQLAMIALAASQGSTPVLRATDVRGRGNRALRGAAAGAAEGGQFGPYGAMGGAAFGAIIGAARNPMFEDLMNRTAHDFGVEVSEELARGMEDVAKSKFGKDRAAALTYTLPSIVAESGGVLDQNADKLTARLRDVFSMVETGKFSMKDATDTLDKAFGFFADHVLKSKDIASKSFQEILALNERFGTQSVAIRDFVEGQTGKLGTNIAMLAGPIVEQYGGLAEQITTAKSEIDKLNADGRAGTEEYAKAVAELTLLQEKQTTDAAATSAEVERLGVIALGAFNASVAAGTDYLTAVERMGPALDTLIGLQTDLGVTGQNVAVQELQNFRDRVNQNQALVLGAKALGETIRALSSIGGLTNETLGAMETQGLETFRRLRDAGFSERESLIQIRDWLLNVMQAHEQLDEPIDENTAALIKQAQEMGLLKADSKDFGAVFVEVGNKIVASIDRMASGLGVDVPNAAGKAADAIARIPTQHRVDFQFNIPDMPDLPGATLPGAAGGIYATGPTATWFAEGGQPELGGPVDFMGKVLSFAMARRGGDMGGDLHVHVNAQNSFFQTPQDMDRLANVMSAAVIRKLGMQKRFNVAA